MSMLVWRDQIQFHGTELIKQALLLPAPVNDEILYVHLQHNPSYSKELFHFNRESSTIEPDPIKKDLKTVHTSLHLYIQALQKQCLPPYRQHIQRLCAGEISGEEAIVDHRDEIQNGFRAISPLLEMSRRAERLKRIFERNFCKECYCLLDELKRHHDCIFLQGLLGEQLPFKQLLDVALRQSEADILEEFITKLYKQRVSAAIVHNALKAGVESFLDQNPTLIPNLEHLESALQDQWESRNERSDWALFETPDPEKVEENRLLKPGSSITSCEKTFVLGEEIGRCSLNRFFTVINQPSHSEPIVLWFPPNVALPGLMKCRALEQEADRRSHCLPLNCPTYVDPRGRFCVVERLHKQLGGPEWKVDYLQPVVEWLAWLREIGKTPSHFRPEYIHFNSKGELVAVKEMRPLPYHAGAVEVFVKKIVGGDLILFNKAMRDISG